MKKNAFYAQSGGVTAVINASACGVIEACRKNKDKIGKLYAGENGILGAIHEEMFDTSKEKASEIKLLMQTPGGIFGSARYKLNDINKNRAEYDRLIEVFKAHNIGYFFYNGGGDSMDTCHKVSMVGKELGYPVICIGVPKTVDNDLPITDTSPGFGSVAKYTAVSTIEATLDVASMAKTSTKVFISEVMGRHAGWIAASAGLAGVNGIKTPHIILFPEIPFDQTSFLNKVKHSVDSDGFCVVVVSEGVKNKDGSFLSEVSNKDAFGHTQLGGVAQVIAQLVQSNLGYKYHYAIADYLQRSARHIASKVDLDQAYAVGAHAVTLALQGKNAVMPTIKRLSDSPYRWKINHTSLSRVANKEKKLPRSYISKDGFSITKSCERYLRPLIMGEPDQKFANGIPRHAKLNFYKVAKLINKKFVLE
jgi:ATP-dependent phosphofructokinase / diphosphate-dependent phosphofructokinase